MECQTNEIYFNTSLNSNDIEELEFKSYYLKDSECNTSSNIISLTSSLQNLIMPVESNLNSFRSLPVLSKPIKNKYEKIRENVLQKARYIEARGQKAAIFGNKVVIHGSLEYFKERERNRKAVQNSRAKAKIQKILDSIQNI
jgi:hypothetical protein